MSVRNLDKVFRPKSVAVIGASRTPHAVGSTVMHNLKSAGFAGPIYPVNPKYRRIANTTCYADVGLLPDTPDLAVICTPAPTVPDVVRRCGEKGIRGLVILTAGFRETGAKGDALEHAVLAAAAPFDGLRIVGPNCLGVMSPHAALNASFANGNPSKGHIAFLSQSGALCTAVLDWALQEKIGFSYFVSIGNTLDVSVGDLIDYFANDRYTESIILYVESITEAREFMSAARAFARKKPIIAYKAGRFAESAEAAASHTGAMAGVDTVYEAAFRRAGVVRIHEMADMFNCAELLARERVPRGPRLAIVTNAGGPGVMSTDALLERQGVLAKLSDTTIGALNQQLSAVWSHRNPVDVVGDASPVRLAGALTTVLADDGVDAALVVFAPQAISKPTDAARAVVKVAKASSKPVLTSWMGGLSMSDGVKLLGGAGVPNYATPEQAVRAFMYLVSYARTREVLYETPRDIPVEFTLDRNRLRAVFNTILTEGHDTLSESTSKALLEAYEIPVAKPYTARNAGDAIEFARRVGYPVAMKILSPQITHKTEVDGVALGLADDGAVRAAFDRILATARERRPDAHIEGVTVQKMVSHPSSYELIVGAKRDPVFGAVLLVGAGGTAAEVFQDRALELPPLSERLARRMLESLRSWPLLNGYRGRPPVDIDRLIEVLMRISYLVADYPEIKELDVNPLLVTPDDAIALDARIILDHSAVLHPVRPFSHLAIRPYPEEYHRQVKLKDGRRVLLRAIRPEDEPMWHDLLANCSRESIWFRFRYVFKQTTHEMATRYCFIDYDREIAIVAEIEEDDRRRLVGVGRLVADPDNMDAEYAVLIVDAFQDQGLGSLLTDYCLAIAADRGIKSVMAETDPQNHRMIELMKNRAFDLDYSMAPDVVLGKKNIVAARLSVPG